MSYSFRGRGNLVAGAVLIGAVFLTGLFAPLIAPADPLAQHLAQALQPPSGLHWFGTDQFGRDLLSRVIFGARLSLFEMALGVGLAMAVGVPLGLIAGHRGGRVDEALSWSMNVVFAFPGLVLAILIVSVLGTDLVDMLVAIAIFSMPAYFRLTRGLTMSLKQTEFAEAAVAMGAGTPRLLVRHILRNAMAPLIVQATLGAGTVVLSAASLSFLGLGVQPPAPEWGAMMSSGRDYLGVATTLSLFPGLAILVTVLGSNLLGDGLRDLLDPRG
jgi:ABC-type dipeptide/oligopeptide/nickel transport system permease subunit